MNEENSEQQVNNLPSVDFIAPKNNNSKLAISMGGILIALLVIGFFVYKNYHVAENQPIQTQEVVVKAGYSLYEDKDTAISFQYPQTLTLLDRDEDGSKMLPNLFFQSYQYPEGFSRNACPIDCINFSAWSSPDYKLPNDLSFSV